MDQDLKATLSRIAEALARLAPAAAASADMDGAEAYVWHAAGHRLEAVPKVNRVPIELLKGVDHQKATLLENTERFAKALPANNALLWGSRGSGKSLILKAVPAPVNARVGGPPRPAGAGRDPSRGHSLAAGAAQPHPRQQATLRG